MEIPQAVIDFLKGINLWNVVSIIIIVGFVARFIWKKGWRSTKAFAKGVMSADKVLDSVKDLPEFMAKAEEALKKIPEMDKKLDVVHHEIFPNSGGSLRDQVDKANKRIGLIEDGLGLTRHDDTNVSDIQ